VIPPLVERAQALAARLGFERSCLDQEGMLLHLLAARRGVERAGEIGTGVGVGAAWIVSALDPAVTFVTVELDWRRAEAASTLFAEDRNVRVLSGSWRELMRPQAPFDLLFVDCGDAKDDPEAVVGLLTPGGTAVLVDFRFDTGLPDERRDPWVTHPDLLAAQLWVTCERPAIVAVRRR
jgi:predicted O-methyltransferase YrrM